MIDDFNADGTGWARFSDDRTMRYRLARSLPLAPGVHFPITVGETGAVVGSRRVAFLLLNPSAADAFRLDPTVKRCVAFAISWHADVIEVVNIFALRSTDPNALYRSAHGFRGDDRAADEQILLACMGAYRVVAGWGKHGALDHRGHAVRGRLQDVGIRLHHLGLNKDGSPKHPLYLKGGTEPQEWT